MLEDLLLRPAVLAPVVLAVGYVLYLVFWPSDLPDLPIMGARTGEWFPLLRASIRNMKDPAAVLDLAHGDYKEQAVILPFASTKPIVVLPRSEISWIIDQPDNKISMLDLTVDTLQIDYTTADPQIVYNPIHQHLITTTLTSQTGNLIPAMADETEHAVSEYWGNDTDDFGEICVWEAMRHIITRVTNRVFVGLPFCRNKTLLDAGMGFAEALSTSGTMLKFFPPLLRPLAAPVLTMQNHKHSRTFLNTLRPLTEQRIRDYDARLADPGTKAAAERPPNDFLQWLVDQAKKSGDPYHCRADTISSRVLILNFVSIHTSSFAMTHVLLDLVHSKQEYIDELREEITAALAAHGGEWNKRALAGMPKLDSTLRESQRLHSLTSVSVLRLVTAREGVTTPSGVHLGKGHVVGVNAQGVSTDPAVYRDPETFRPFRFAGQARQTFAATQPTYLPFGHGRHACPGRFFVAGELKMMLAYLVMNYDFDLQEKRPGDTLIGVARIPPLKATIRVKRRA